MRKDFTRQWVALGMDPDLANILNTEICAGFVVQTTLNYVRTVLARVFMYARLLRH